MSNEILHHLDPDRNFVPDYTTLVRMSYSMFDDGIEITLSDAEIYDEIDIGKFLKALANNALPAPSTTKKPDPAAPGSLGIPVTDPTNIVIALDSKRKWQFRSGNPAVTSKKDYGPANLGVWHVDDGGNILTDHPDKCEVAYFSVVSRPSKGNVDDVQKFNIHLELKQKNGKWIEISIDPDVPELGGEGFPNRLSAKSSRRSLGQGNSLFVSFIR